MRNHKILERDGRYAMIKQNHPIVPYVICCGYCDKTHTWGHGVYCKTLDEATNEYNERTGYACRDCKNRHMENHPTWCMK